MGRLLIVETDQESSPEPNRESHYEQSVREDEVIGGFPEPPPAFNG
jgi:hypothetical protein